MGRCSSTGIFLSVTFLRRSCRKEHCRDTKATCRAKDEVSLDWWAVVNIPRCGDRIPGSPLYGNRLLMVVITPFNMKTIPASYWTSVLTVTLFPVSKMECFFENSYVLFLGRAGNHGSHQHSLFSFDFFGEFIFLLKHLSTALIKHVVKS
jgi:hypothetical protein